MVPFGHMLGLYLMKYCNNSTGDAIILILEMTTPSPREVEKPVLGDVSGN